MTDLLAGNFSEDLIRDRIILIGSIAPSLNDFLRTPYNNSAVTGTTQSPGVMVHTHIASQILSAALDGRALIQVWPNWMEFIWALLWGTAGSLTIIIPLQQNRSILTVFSRTSVPILGLSTGLFLVNGLLFFNGVWVPTIPALLSLLFSGILSLAQHNSKLLQYAYIDGLTCLPNRRYFNQRLADSQDEKQQVSIILCDVDHFKAFNDNYGHPAGDVCLQKVAYAIQQAVRRQDVISRYGGEEFAVILQNTPDEIAYEIAERMRSKVQESQIPHDFSGVSKYVSISCGVASRAADDSGPISKLLVASDKALYRAKRAGRNRVFVLQDNDVIISPGD
ncbi:MAG: diguanylate cyclase [Leptolyngbya sp. RL_3_1]|nr:diguanylate cyclase [Leptolyngbya sp. RL_3_1]